MDPSILAFFANYVVNAVAWGISAVGIALQLKGLQLQRRLSTPVTAGGTQLAREFGPSLFDAEVQVEARISRTLIDREEELHGLEHAVRQRIPVLVIEGAPGMGKSTLAAALCRRLLKE